MFIKQPPRQPTIQTTRCPPHAWVAHFPPLALSPTQAVSLLPVCLLVGQQHRWNHRHWATQGQISLKPGFPPPSPPCLLVQALLSWLMLASWFLTWACAPFSACLPRWAPYCHMLSLFFPLTSGLLYNFIFMLWNIGYSYSVSNCTKASSWKNLFSKDWG